MPEPTYVGQGADFSPDRVHRYLLWRHWDKTKPSVIFVMLNPSTADAAKLDPTLRRCLGFAQAWGFGGFEVLNIFAFRSTKPMLLASAEDPVGPENDEYLVSAAESGALIVAAWGAHGCLFQREERVLELLLPRTTLHALALTRTGHPGHPLYLSKLLRPQVWRERRAA